MSVKTEYLEAIDLYNRKKYDEAEKAFDKLKDYKDSKEYSSDIKYSKAVNMMNSKQYAEAANMFSQLRDYKDSKEQVKEATYCSALSMIDEKDYKGAYEKLKSLGHYKDCSSKLSKLIEANNGILRTAAVGETVRFGGRDWRVLDKNGNRLLIISKISIANKEYNKIKTNITWETCTLRKWLNNDWLSSAFSDGERAMIEETTVKNSDNPTYGTNGGNDTVDKVFLLSIDEANKYFSSDSDRSTGSEWWLRSPGCSQSSAAGVDSGGTVYANGYYVNYDSNGVRPAMWINIE